MVKLWNVGHIVSKYCLWAPKTVWSDVCLQVSSSPFKGLACAIPWVRTGAATPTPPTTPGRPPADPPAPSPRGSEMLRRGQRGFELARPDPFQFLKAGREYVCRFRATTATPDHIWLVIIVWGLPTANPRALNAACHAFGSTQTYQNVYFRHLFGIKHSSFKCLKSH